LQEEVEKALLERGVVEEALGGLLEQNNALLLKLDDAVQASLVRTDLKLVLYVVMLFVC
jgi:hypothetical protein